MDPQLLLTIAFCVIIAFVAGVVALSAASAPDPMSEAPGEHDSVARDRELVPARAAVHGTSAQSRSRS
ncbi:MAG TPA: hypothetical protein VFI37_09650 [Gaiellaceae bacterium]|jgi:hypothetical protein|nr:hypothetical protein [Gaiellaceae bacterium]